MARRDVVDEPGRAGASGGDLSRPSLGAPSAPPVAPGRLAGAAPLDPATAKRRKSIVWRFAVLIVGSVVILAGIAIAPLPGPGPMVLGPIGLAILATEFEWARRLLVRVKSGAADFQAHTDRLTGLVSRIWILPVVAVYWFLVWQATRWWPESHRIIWAVGISTFIPVAYGCYRVAVIRARQQPLRKMWRKIKAKAEARRSQGGRA